MIRKSSFHAKNTVRSCHRKAMFVPYYLSPSKFWNLKDLSMMQLFRAKNRDLQSTRRRQVARSYNSSPLLSMRKIRLCRNKKTSTTLWLSLEAEACQNWPIDQRLRASKRTIGFKKIGYHQMRSHHSPIKRRSKER